MTRELGTIIEELEFRKFKMLGYDYSLNEDWKFCVKTPSREYTVHDLIEISKKFDSGKLSERERNEFLLTLKFLELADVYEIRYEILTSPTQWLGCRLDPFWYLHGSPQCLLELEKQGDRIDTLRAIYSDEIYRITL